MRLRVFYKVFTALFYRFAVVCGGVVDEFAVFGKAGAVAGAVPCVLGRIIFECTSEVRTAWHGRGNQSYGSLKSVQQKLRAQYATGRGKYGCIRVIFAAYKVAEYFCRRHGVCHAPLVESVCCFQCKYTHIFFPFAK